MLPVFLANSQIGEVKTVSSLSATLETVRTNIDRFRGKGLTEENTKTALINPVLCALGWHVGNLDEVSQEFRLDSSHNPVDYALLLGEHPIVLVEAKGLGQSLAGGKWADQIMGYAGTSGVTWVVLTNGDEYRIYNAIAPVPFEQKLFRKVCLTKPDDPTEDTLALLSKERINDIDAQWQIHFADSQVLVAIDKLFSPAPDSLSHLVSFVKKHVKGLPAKDIRASLGRLRTSFKFPVYPANPPGGTGTNTKREVGDEGYRDFWEPIQTEPNGLFAGKPSRWDRIGKVVRRDIWLGLVVLNHACYVDLGFSGEDREERRDMAVKIFLAAKYPPHELRESDKGVSVRFPVLDKGIKDRGDWDKMRKKLTKLGGDIYNILSNSDV